MSTSGIFRTDGTELYFERRGTGPALLMISGGGGDAVLNTGVAESLADAYTVLTYDRRGNSRSTVDDPSAPLRMDEQCRDALAVLEHNGLKSAYVFGGSGGALIGLDLTARYPESVDGLIAHEPPVIGLLPDAETYRRLFAEIGEITRREGAWAGFARFAGTIDREDDSRLLHSRAGRWVVAIGMRVMHAVGRLGPSGLRDMARFLGNSDQLMRREMEPFLAFEPDLDALAAGGVPIVLGGGAESRPYYTCRPGEIIAERLGVPFVEFPGAHAGYSDVPKEFAPVLRATLARFGTEGEPAAG